MGGEKKHEVLIQFEILRLPKMPYYSHPEPSLSPIA